MTIQKTAIFSLLCLLLSSCGGSENSKDSIFVEAFKALDHDISYLNPGQAEYISSFFFDEGHWSKSFSANISESEEGDKRGKIIFSTFDFEVVDLLFKAAAELGDRSSIKDMDWNRLKDSKKLDLTIGFKSEKSTFEVSDDENLLAQSVASQFYNDLVKIRNLESCSENIELCLSKIAVTFWTVLDSMDNFEEDGFSIVFVSTGHSSEKEKCLIDDFSNSLEWLRIAQVDQKSFLDQSVHCATEEWYEQKAIEEQEDFERRKQQMIANFLPIKEAYQAELKKTCWIQQTVSWRCNEEEYYKSGITLDLFNQGLEYTRKCLNRPENIKTDLDLKNLENIIKYSKIFFDVDYQGQIKQWSCNDLDQYLNRQLSLCQKAYKSPIYSNGFQNGYPPQHSGDVIGHVRHCKSRLKLCEIDGDCVSGSVPSSNDYSMLSWDYFQCELNEQTYNDLKQGLNEFCRVP